MQDFSLFSVRPSYDQLDDATVLGPAANLVQPGFEFFDRQMFHACNR